MTNSIIENNMIFDSSFNFEDKIISEKEYLDFLYSSFQKINQQRFLNEPVKQKINLHKDRITGCCPICGDSMKSQWKQRGNIILTGKFKNYYKCFNCSKFYRIDQFFKDFKIDLQLDIINYISNNLQDFSIQSNDKYDMSLFLDMESIDKLAIDKEEFLKFFNLIEAKDSSIWIWLKHRLQYDVSKFLYNQNKNHLLILNLTSTGKILGVQKRLFKGKSKYLTFKLSRLYELMGKTNKIPDEIDTISQIFNICLINLNKPIILCEGPLDAFLLNNCIANCGANKSFPLDLQIKYLYDYDKTGIEHAIEKIKNENEIFLWSKFLKDINAPYRQKWDITDIKIWAKENNVKLPNIYSYFSNNSLDIIDL